jgi:hypothetical protein
MMMKKLAGWGAAMALVAGAAMAQSSESIPPPTSAMPAQEGLPYFDDMSGPDANLGGYSYGYLRITGSSFVARNAANPPVYQSAGCISAPTAGAIYAADLQLPQDARIVYVRTYYYNAGVGGDIRTYLTEFDGAGAYVERTNFATPTSGTGYNSALSPELSLTYDPFNRSYIVAINISSADPNLRFCGVRVQYHY